MKLWIDTDAGVDDATAILIALNTPGVEIVGISCVGGNAHLENVIRNVNRTLKVYGNESIPIYGGCTRALIQELMVIPEIHGHDGLGDIDDSKFGTNTPQRLESEHAVTALIKAADSVEGLHLLALAPLTNIAIAFRMNPVAMNKIEKIIIMGGAEDGKGNTSEWAEFNFRCDPESAKIVFDTYPAHKTVMASWTLTVHHELRGEEKDDIAGREGTLIEKFLHDTWKAVLDFTQGVLMLSDPLAGYVACYPEGIVKSERMKVNVVIHGEKLGMTECTPDPNGVLVVKDINMDHFKQIMHDLMKLK